jgi:hypothetical protein
MRRAGRPWDSILEAPQLKTSGERLAESHPPAGAKGRREDQ